MKILQINNYGYLRGGSEKVFFDTIKVLRENKHEVEVFFAEGEKDKAVIDGNKVNIINWQERKGVLKKIKGVKDFIYNSDVAKRLDVLLNRFRPDIVHIHIYYGRLSNSIIEVINRHSIPIVQSVHEYRLLCPAYTCLNGNNLICTKCKEGIFKWNCIKGKCVKNSYSISFIAAMECSIRDLFFSNIKQFSYFIMVSDFIKQLHIEAFPKISSKCEVLYNSVDLNLYSKFRSKNKSNYILYFGRLSKEKGILTLLKAISDFPNIELKIAGSGPLEKDIQKKIKSLGLRNVSMLGYMSGGSLFQLIAQARFVMVPSEWYENNPLSIIESFALGTPVIGSNIGGIPELITSGKTGYLHNIKDINGIRSALAQAYSLSSLDYEMMCGKCIRFAEEHFDSNKYYFDLINIYNKVLHHE